MNERRARRAGGRGRRRGRGGTGRRRRRLRRNPPVAREGQARSHLDALEGPSRTTKIVTGMINGRVKGGFTVDIDLVRAFLPGSLVDVRPVRDPTYSKASRSNSRSSSSTKAQQRRRVAPRGGRRRVQRRDANSCWRICRKASVLKGIVKNLTDYGAFVDLGGIDGLLHITDMAWKRVKHPV
jgi:small subunit ribosomal protein S1